MFHLDVMNKKVDTIYTKCGFHTHSWQSHLWDHIIHIFEGSVETGAISLKFWWTIALIKTFQTIGLNVK